MLTNQIVISINNSPEVAIFLPKAMFIHVLFGPWYKSVTSLGVGFHTIDTTSGCIQVSVKNYVGMQEDA